ncbi:MAG: hypothetical protein MUD10_00080 [Candidatus Pacebacteria bacterium]|jgi:hypothetical protein|nr:hypothetical protein [Candidatus Paceibacterota bacterium]
MIKLKETAIKTMADALMAGGRDLEKTNSPAESSEEIIFLNRKLREAFKISPNPKSAPAPQFSTAQEEPKKPEEKLASEAEIIPKKAPVPAPSADEIPPLPTNEDFLATKIESAPEELGRVVRAQAAEAEEVVSPDKKNIDDLRKIKEELEEQQKKNEIKAAETRKKRDEEIAAEREKERQLAEDDKKRKESESAAKLERERRIAEEEMKRREKEKMAQLAREEAKREEERLATQEKLRQEKLRAQIEAERKKEERRQQLAELEVEREKEKIRRAEEDKKKHEQEEAAKQASLQKAKDENSGGETLLEALDKLASRLRSQKTYLERQLSGFPETSDPLKKKKLALEVKIDQIKSSELAVNLKNENEIEKQLALEKEKLDGKISIQQEKLIEQKIWDLEEQRKEAEKKRWGVEDNINKIAEEKDAVAAKIAVIAKEETAVSQKIKTISGQEKLVYFAQEKWKMEQEMLGNVNDRNAITPVLGTALNQKNSVAAKLQELTDKEKVLKINLAEIEQKEKQASNPSEKRAIEQERWHIGEDLKSTIKEKWGVEEKLKANENEIQEIQGKIDNINKKIGHTQNIISNNEATLEKEGLAVRRIRDEISKFFKENGLEVNSEILSEIIQPDDLASNRDKKSQSIETDAKPAIATSPVKTQPPTRVISAKSEIAPNKPVPGITKEPAKPADQPKPTAPMSTATAAPATKETKTNPAPAATPQPTVPAQIPTQSQIKKEPPMQPSTPAPAAIPTKSVDASPAVQTQKPIQPQTEIKPAAPNVQPATQPAAPEPVAPIAPASAPNIEIRPQPAPAIIPPKEPILTPDTKLSDIIKNTRPEMKTERPAPVVNSIPASAIAVPPVVAAAAGANAAKPAAGAYMEQIEIDPATNIRSFQPAEKAATQPAAPETAAPAARVQRGPTDEDMQGFGGAGKEDLEVFGSGDPGDAWGDRWGQIKKTTTPAGNQAAAVPGTIQSVVPGAMPYTPAEPAADQVIGASKTGGNKTLVRIIVVLVLLGILGIAITLVLLKNGSPTPTGGEEPSEETTIKKPGEEETPAKPVKPTTTLAVLETKTIYTEDAASIPNVLFPYLQSPFDSDGYYRIIIQNKKDKTNISLRQFFSVFKVTAPASFYSAASDDFILFIYANKGKNRLGIVTTTDNANGLKKALADWEPNMVANTDNLFKFLGRKTQSATATLKFDSDATSDNVQYRTLVFSPATDNYAIAYTIYKEKYLALTTSNEAMIKIFNQLPK